jgi:heat shock protein HslJ
MVASATGAPAQRATRAPSVDPNEGKVQTQKMDKQFPLGWAWSGVSLNGKPFTTERPTLTVDENLRGSGFAGCNTFSASMYPLKEQAFAVGPLAVTRRSCDKGVNEAERALLVALRTAQKWDTVAGRLVIKSQAGELVFERAL